MKLSAYLKKHQESASAFAQRANFSRSAVSLWISGKRKPMLNIALQIKELTNGEVDTVDWFTSKKGPFVS